MIYENVKCLCEKNNISIQALERELGIGNGAIGKWQGRSASPRVSTVQKIAERFGVTVDELLKPERGRK